MKIQKLEEQENRILVETYQVEQSALSELYQQIGKIAEDRGNGVLCEALCSICSYKLGIKINPDEYVVHHLNGYHTDNDFRNLALIKLGTIGWTHEAVHRSAMRSAISQLMFDLYHFPNGQTITDADIRGLSNLQLLKLCFMISQTLQTGTERKSNNWKINGGVAFEKGNPKGRNRQTNQYDIILIKDIIK